MIDRRAEMALDAIRPQAERELDERRRVAAVARERLQPIHEAERVAENEQRRQRERSYGMER